MISRRSRSILSWCLALGLLGSVTASAQFSPTGFFIQGSDYDTALQLGNPNNWTAVPLNPNNRSLTFLLNPCEYVTYVDTAGRFRTCLPRVGICSKLPAMEVKLEVALSKWGNLAPDGLTFNEVEILGDTCPTNKNDCPTTGGWVDDEQWVVTRSYQVAGVLPAECEDAATGSVTAGLALRLYDDSMEDHTTRWVQECDIIYGARAWDVSEDHPCLDHFNPQECIAGTTMGLVQEVGHCLGFGHSYLTRRSLEPLEVKYGLANGVPSIMSYDHPGSVEIFTELGPYDKAMYLYTYAVEPDPDATHFTAYGTVVKDSDNDCTPLTNPQPVFGAAVFALDVSATPWRPVHVSMTGVDPLGAGEFELKYLDRGTGNTYYRLLVADARDGNQMYANGWDWDELPGPTPAMNVIRTDDWSVENSGNAYKFEASSFFATGFDDVLKGSFQAPATTDHNAGQICVEF